MKVACVILLGLLVGNSAIVAQESLAGSVSSGTTSVTHQGKALISGIVIKEPGSEGVKKVLIELIAESQSGAGNYTAVSGADGRFHIEDIIPGRYHLFAERTGFQEVDRRHRRTDGRVLTLSAGQEIEDLVIPLQAAAVVEGRVTDEDGDPIAEAQVAVLRRTFVAGRSHWEQAGAERTNDLGEYRIAALPSGSYFISVTPPPDFRSLIEAARNASTANDKNAAAEKSAPATYQTTYYPGTRDRGQAQAIQLRGGDDFPANFSLTPSPSLTIRGTVVNLPPGSSAAVTLQSQDFSLMLNGAEMHKDGSFEIRDVSPGAYTILATVDSVTVPMMARQALLLASTNIEGLRLAPQLGGSIHGRLRVETEGNGKPDPGQVFFMLRSVDGDDDMIGEFNLGYGFSTVAHVNNDGSFEWKNVPPGRYAVKISEVSSVPDWFLKSVSAGGRDVSDSGFSVSAGITTLDLIASARGASADGVATNQKDEPIADAVVVAVPAARYRTQPDRYRKTVTDQSGRFTLRGLPPGDYTLYAWESVEGEAYYNSEFLKTYEGQGQALHVNEGERKSVQIKVVLGADDNSLE